MWLCTLTSYELLIQLNLSAMSACTCSMNISRLLCSMHAPMAFSLYKSERTVHMVYTYICYLSCIHYTCIILLMVSLNLFPCPSLSRNFKCAPTSTLPIRATLLKRRNRRKTFQLMWSCPAYLVSIWPTLTVCTIE